MKEQTESRQDEETLVAAASNGDLDAFNQLILNFQDLAYRHAYSILGEATTAEDVTQDSFIKAFQGLNAFRGGSFRGWLLRIVTNSAYDILRRSQRRPTQPLYPQDDDGEELDTAPWLVDPVASVQGTVEHKELSEEVSMLMQQLPETYRNVLTLVDLYEFDYVEAAETLRIPIGTVKSRLARARLQMKEKLKSSDIFKNTVYEVGLRMAA